MQLHGRLFVGRGKVQCAAVMREGREMRGCGARDAVPADVDLRGERTVGIGSGWPCCVRGCCLSAALMVCLIICCERMLRDVVDGVLHGDDGGGHFVLDVDDEFVLQHHHNLNLVQAVKAEILESAANK